MNKTLSIGMAGFSFIIDEYAYIKLSDYLNALRSSLEPSEADEVMNDIEIRMVEIFKESLGKREVINDSDIEKVIAQIGKPEIIEEQEESYFTEEHSNKKKQYHKGQSSKVLFRDPEHNKIAGVCAGLAHYFGVQIGLMRGIFLIFLLLGVFTEAVSILFVVVIYIILWILIPEAVTASDFLKMKGKPLDFDSLKEQSNKVLKFANESSQKANEIYENSKPYIKSTRSRIGKVIRGVLGVFFGFLGFIFFIVSMIIILIPSTISLGNEFSFLIVGKTRFLIIITLFLSGFIPAFVLLFFSLKLLSPKTKFNRIGYGFGGLVLVWIISLVITVSLVMNQTMPYLTGDNVETDNIALAMPKDSTFILEDKIVKIPENFQALSNGTFYYNDERVYREMKHKKLEVVRKDGNFEPYLIVEKTASGYNKPLKMNVPLELNGNKIALPNFVAYPFEYRFRTYYIYYELVVPKYMKIIDNSKLQYINDRKLEVEKEEEEDTFDEANISINIKNNKNRKPTATTDISLNGKSWKILEYGNDYVTINDKKYPAHRLNEVLDSLHILRNYQDLKRWYNESQNLNESSNTEQEPKHEM